MFGKLPKALWKENFLCVKNATVMEERRRNFTDLEILSTEYFKKHIC